MRGLLSRGGGPGLSVKGAGYYAQLRYMRRPLSCTWRGSAVEERGWFTHLWSMGILNFLHYRMRRNIRINDAEWCCIVPITGPSPIASRNGRGPSSPLRVLSSVSLASNLSTRPYSTHQGRKRRMRDLQTPLHPSSCSQSEANSRLHHWPAYPASSLYFRGAGLTPSKAGLR